MKSILDPDFEHTPSVETDIRATFERVWRELDTRDQSHTSSGEDCNSVWLECNGELVDSCSVKVLAFANPPSASRCSSSSVRAASNATNRFSFADRCSQGSCAA
jgi:hypothetical protein